MLKILIISFFALIILNANDFKQETYTIEKVKNNRAVIHRGSLRVGQSGVIIHHFKDKKSMILLSATVVSSHEDFSIIEFMSNKILEQKSISSTNLKPRNGDDFILNHMYNISLLLVPNFQSYKAVKINHSNNFIDSELFAGYLRINENPRPSKENLLEFTSQNNIATIYLVIENKIYILDALTFSIIKIKSIKVDDSKTQVPFYTKISNIKKSIFDFTSDGQIEDYNTYYKNLIGIK